MTDNWSRKFSVRLFNRYYLDCDVSLLICPFLDEVDEWNIECVDEWNSISDAEEHDIHNSECNLVKHNRADRQHLTTN